jgi:hypothetical protein
MNVLKASQGGVAPDRTGRLKWVEPEVRTLEVKETALFTRIGPDGGHVAPDCTHS